MGELREGQPQNFDQEIMPFISSCNIACGFHSGTPALMEQTILAALRHGVYIGAHPSYNDREHFGRWSMQVPPHVLAADLRYQICAVKGMVESLGGKLHHVKPHGALYNDMLEQEALAELFIQVVKEIDPRLYIFGLAHSSVIDTCQKWGMWGIHEGFADRRYQSRTKLRSRQYSDAVIHEPEAVLAQIDGFRKGQIQLWNGNKCNIQVDTICLHSDTQGAVELSKHIYEHLIEHDVHIAAFP